MLIWLKRVLPVTVISYLPTPAPARSPGGSTRLPFPYIIIQACPSWVTVSRLLPWVWVSLLDWVRWCWCRQLLGVSQLTAHWSCCHPLKGVVACACFPALSNTCVMILISKALKPVFFISDHPETIQEVKIKQPKQQQATEIHSDKLSRECLKHTLCYDTPLPEKPLSGVKHFKRMDHYCPGKFPFVLPFPAEFSVGNFISFKSIFHFL